MIASLALCSQSGRGNIWISLFTVTHAKAVVHKRLIRLDSHFRGNDDFRVFRDVHLTPDDWGGNCQKALFEKQKELTAKERRKL
jgi:hypothetical protein